MDILATSGDINIILIALAFFIVIVSMFAMKPERATRVTHWTMLLSAMGGIMIYTMAYASSATSTVDLTSGILRAVTSAFFMFVGREGYSSVISSWPYFAENAWIRLLFWLIHLMAFYVSLTTVFNAVGKSAIRNLRILQYRFTGNDYLILFGKSDKMRLDSPAAGKALKNGIHVVLVGQDSSGLTIADSLGAIYRNVSEMDNEGKWLKKLGIGKRSNISIICSEATDNDIENFLEKFVKGGNALGLISGQIQATLICRDEYIFFNRNLELGDLNSGGGQLHMELKTPASMSAERMQNLIPLWDIYDFRSEKKCTVLIIGFSTLGQKTLQTMIRNGGFLKDQIEFIVVDRNLKSYSAFNRQYASMMESYNIQCYSYSTDSEEFLDLLDSCAGTLRYAAVCENSSFNGEDKVMLLHRYALANEDNMPDSFVIMRCNREIVGCNVLEKPTPEDHYKLVRQETCPVIDIAELISGNGSLSARKVNDAYYAEEAKRMYPTDPAGCENYLKEMWYGTNLIDRSSCTATAQFMPAYLKLAGVGSYSELYSYLEDEENAEAFGRIEHDRWMAFESSIGVKAMEEEDFKERINVMEDHFNTLIPKLKLLDKEKKALNPDVDTLFAEYKTAQRHSRKQIPFFGLGGVHVCMTDWNNLDHLWDIYKTADYHFREANYYREHIKWQMNDEEGSEPVKPTLEGARGFKQMDINNIKDMSRYYAGQETGKKADE
ncbi:MAG: hypothetical protein K6E77_10830 [Lachnospiraceae bacterium]|nr:hypothetical protein [Lachnospiraceae bacterium]